MIPVSPATAAAAEVLSTNLELELAGYMAELGLDQGEALEILAMNTRTPLTELEGVLAGELWPCPRTLARIARALGVTTDHLLTEDPQPHEPNAERAPRAPRRTHAQNA